MSDELNCSSANCKNSQLVGSELQTEVRLKLQLHGSPSTPVLKRYSKAQIPQGDNTNRNKVTTQNNRANSENEARSTENYDSNY